MRRRFFCLMLVLCMFVTGCGKRGERTSQLEDYGTASGVVQEKQQASDYVSGHWGEKFVRSNGYTYPFVFDDPITQCVGFTLEYEIVEVVEGNLSGNFRYEVYVRKTDGKWKSVKLFQMDGYKTSMYIDLEKMMDIDAVAVVCQKKGSASFNYSIAVCDARYT